MVRRSRACVSTRKSAQRIMTFRLRLNSATKGKRSYYPRTSAWAHTHTWDMSTIMCRVYHDLRNKRSHVNLQQKKKKVFNDRKRGIGRFTRNVCKAFQKRLKSVRLSEFERLAYHVTVSSEKRARGLHPGGGDDDGKSEAGRVGTCRDA